MWGLVEVRLVPVAMGQVVSMQADHNKELLPIVIAAVIWGQSWLGHQVVSQCDNLAVVIIINSH